MIDFYQDPAVDCKPTAAALSAGARGGGDGNKMTDRIGCHTQSLSKVISKTISLGKITEPARGWLSYCRRAAGAQRGKATLVDVKR